MLICICVYIYKYITTDLFLEYFRHWKRGTSLSDQTVPHQVFLWCFLFHRYLFFVFVLFFISTSTLWNYSRSTSRFTAPPNSKRTSSSAVHGTSKKNKWKRKQKGWVFKPSKICVAWQLYVQKKCNQEKLSLWHNHCFLCCIDSKMFKFKKKRKGKKTLGKRSIFVQR